MIDKVFQELASRRQNDSLFITLYIDTKRNDESQRDRIRLFLKHEMQRIRESVGGTNGHEVALESGIRQLEQYMESSLHPATRGMAVFLCPTENLFVPLELPVPVEPRLTIGSRPHLRQLAELKQLYPQVVLAMIDGKSARLFALEFGKILREIDLENPDAPRHHDQGGWSQSNMQRHVQDAIDKHHKEVAEVLTRMVESGRFRNVILSGQDRNLANFRGFLPKRVEEKVIGSLHLDIRSNAEEIISSCLTMLNASEEVRLSERLSALEDAGQKKQRGALGFQAVAEAANERRIEHLFVAHSAAARGWKCTRCELIGVAVPLGCPACGAPVLTADLVEELIAAAYQEKGYVEFVTDHSLLDQYEGAGALLRF